VCFARPLIGCTGPITSKHLSASPTGEPHEVLFLATFREPAVCERMPEHMRMQMIKASLLRSPPQHLANAVVSHHAARTQPKCTVSGEPMLASFPEIALDRLSSPVSERTGTWPVALAKYNGNVLIKINICH
jgi:hypothetical protein